MMRINSRSLRTLSRNSNSIIFMMTTGSSETLPLEPVIGQHLIVTEEIFVTPKNQECRRFSAIHLLSHEYISFASVILYSRRFPARGSDNPIGVGIGDKL